MNNGRLTTNIPLTKDSLLKMKCSTFRNGWNNTFRPSGSDLISLYKYVYLINTGRSTLRRRISRAGVRIRYDTNIVN